MRAVRTHAPAVVALVFMGIEIWSGIAQGVTAWLAIVIALAGGLVVFSGMRLLVRRSAK